MFSLVTYLSWNDGNQLNSRRSSNWKCFFRSLPKLPLETIVGDINLFHAELAHFVRGFLVKKVCVQSLWLFLSFFLLKDC